MNPLLRELLNTGTTTTPDGGQATIDFRSPVTAAEAEMLTSMVADLKAQNTLEVGLAYGFSALSICEGLAAQKEARHIAIDPFQNARPHWGGIGLHNLKRAGFADRIEFHEGPSFRILPQLEAAGRKLDFAFIDGLHNFDYTLVDFFYIHRLLRVGGVVAFDDADWPAVRDAIRFVVTNLPYRVWRVLPDSRQNRTWQRKIFDAGMSVGGRFMAAADRAVSKSQRLARLCGGELMGLDQRYGLVGSCIALRKEGEDPRDTNYHQPF